MSPEVKGALIKLIPVFVGFGLILFAYIFHVCRKRYCPYCNNIQLTRTYVRRFKDTWWDKYVLFWVTDINAEYKFMYICPACNKKFNSFKVISSKFNKYSSVKEQFK